MKKFKYLFVIGVCGLLMLSFSRINDNPDNSAKADNIGSGSNILIVASRQLDANNISTWFRNNGSFNRDPSTGNSGFEWLIGSNKYARYASGLWIGAKVGSDTLVCVSAYDYEYLPGYVDNNGIPQGQNDPNYTIYRITRGDTTSWDYLWWPFMQGAYANSFGKPFFLGTQTLFYSYTDGYPESHGNVGGSTAPLKAVILQTNWCYANVNLRDVIFTEFRIINRNSLPWNNAYISVWTDDDLGTATDDAVGIDTILNMGYTYNYFNTDPLYGEAPPAVGFLTLRNPIVPSPGDTARYYSPPGTNNLIVRPGYKEMKLSSFNLYTNSVGDPMYFRETYRVMQGLKRDGTSWINPYNQQPSKFPYSGDPATSTGWIETGSGDRRSQLNFGPFTMNPNDTQSVIVAQLIDRGSDNRNSVAKLRDLANYVKSIYNSNFQSVLSANAVSSEIPDKFSLHQNYPNPFNPKTIINYELKITNFVKMIVFDALGKEVATLVNEKQSATGGPGTYEVEFDGSGLPSGVYFYRLTAGEFTDTKRMMLLK